MKRGKDYIIFPLDVATEAAACDLVALLHRDVGMFKIGLELFVRCGPALVRWVTEQGGARVFLDLKLHDIPVTVERAMQGIADLDVALATVHCGDSGAMLEAAVRGSRGVVGVLGVTVLTSISAAQLQAAGYRDELAIDVERLVLHKAESARAAGCSGVVCSGREVAAIKARMGAPFMAVTPGIRPAWGTDTHDDQHRVVTPAEAVTLGADHLVIGRPIRNAADPVSAARRIGAEIDAVLPRPYSRQ